MGREEDSNWWNKMIFELIRFRNETELGRQRMEERMLVGSSKVNFQCRQLP